MANKLVLTPMREKASFETKREESLKNTRKEVREVRKVQSRGSHCSSSELLDKPGSASQRAPQALMLAFPPLTPTFPPPCSELSGQTPGAMSIESSPPSRNDRFPVPCPPLPPTVLYPGQGWRGPPEVTP